MIEELIEKYPDDDFLIADGFDEAIIGMDETEMRIIYSVKKCIKKLEEEMEIDEAMEYFTFNVSEAYMGEKTPIWCWDI